MVGDRMRGPSDSGEGLGYQRGDKGSSDLVRMRAKEFDLKQKESQEAQKKASEVHKQLNSIIQGIQGAIQGEMFDRNKSPKYNDELNKLSKQLEIPYQSAENNLRGDLTEETHFLNQAKEVINSLSDVLKRLEKEQEGQFRFRIATRWNIGINSCLEQINRQGSSSLPDFEMRDNPQTRHEEIETSTPDRTTIQNQQDAASTSVSHTKHEITGASTSHSADPAEQITQALSEIQPVKVELSWTTKWVDEMREKLCLLPEEHRPQRMKKKFKQLSDHIKSINNEIRGNYIPEDLSRKVVKITLLHVEDFKKFYTQACDYREGSKGRQSRREGEAENR